MTKFPEILQFRAKPGSAIEAVAIAERKRSSDVVREAIEAHLAGVKVSNAERPAD